MWVLGAARSAAARPRGFGANARASALLSLVGSFVAFVAFGACSRRAETPVVVDAALERPSPPAPPWLKDAAVDQGVAFDAQGVAFDAQGVAFDAQGVAFDAQGVAFDAQPDMAGPPRGHGHRAAAAARRAAGGFKVSGSITKADAETVLHGARAKLNACYDREHAQNAALAGRVIFRLSIDNRGRVPLAEVLTSTLGGGDPELCMVEALRDLKFPPSSTGGESTLTFSMAFGR